MGERKWVFVLGWLVLAGSLGPGALLAQDPQPSVAEAARHSREQKKKSAKPTTVVTDDTLQRSPRVPGAATQESVKATQPVGLETPAAEDAKQTNGAAADKERRKKAEIEALKQRITEQKELVKLAEREIALQQDTFYSNPDYAHDQAGKDRLAALKAELQQQQDTLADFQSKLAALGGTEDPAPSAAKP